MKSRDEYIQLLHQKLDEWNGEIDRLMAKKQDVEEESRQELQNQVEALEHKRDELEQKMGELSSAGADAWEDLRAGIDLSWEAMNAAVTSAVKRFFK
jgi:predicted nuclease with TOPRIM domain